MDEKKIFLAYTYRALALLYKYLYSVRAELIFDNMYAHEEEKECACRDVMPTMETSLLLHYKIAKTIQENYTVSKQLDKILDRCIIKLLDNRLPTVGEAIGANLIHYSVDKYNPIFIPLLSGSSTN